MKQVVKLKWDGNTVKIENAKGTFTRTYEKTSMDMWRFSVLGQLPKGKSVKKTKTPTN